ncbi:hypothetical protein H2198_008894 [Neophaeococcomyces mojaviensis]|uniref:Uncharacterized protein n=1 Tax=Neophaeococcomyces mojaviensis TaxID=3383035 RepID=A0ACC2ZWL9_9EURO|nr:hypothetical protein H2198_008894 [Knufia sp. JES_112]
MGLAGRKLFLPAPTDSLVDESTGEEPGVSEDVATDLSQRTDQTHHTIPEDGSPITISTKKKISTLDKIKGNHPSQTSLLIEYFEGGKGSDPNRRPSVRVKVIPSSRRNKEKGESHIVLTEAHGTRKRSTSRRISLGSRSPQIAAVDSEISAIESERPPGLRDSAPLDIEIQQHSDLSEVSGSPEIRYIPASSDISSMPADSILGLQQSTLLRPTSRVVEGSNLSSLPAEESVLSAVSDMPETTGLKPPMNTRGPNSSNERITQKVIEKLSNKPKEPVRIAYGRSDKSSSRNTSRDAVTTSHDRPAVTTKQFKDDDSVTSPTERSVLSNSVISIGGKSISDHSVRSAATNNSINNPKLLQTVEDAIRRLILPELKELKKDQRQNSHRSRKYEKDYGDLSESSVVREKSTKRSASGSKSRRRTSKESADRSGSRRRRSSHRDHDYDSMSDSSSRREASVSSTSAEDPALMKKHKDKRAKDVVAAGLAGAGLTAAALEEKESEESLQRRRRRKRSKSRSSRSASIAESEEIFHKHKVPPMPMASDLNSDLTQVTRSSILSSNTSVGTPVHRGLQEVTRGSPRQLETHTPPKQTADYRNSLGMHHGNLSEHNLSSSKLAYELHDDETLSPETERYGSFSAEDLLEDPERMRRYEQNLHTQHPIRRGLSPIQSVASYATTEPNRHSLMQPRSSDTLASMQKRNQQLKEEVSISSFVSAPSPDFKKNRPHGISLENRSEVMSQHRDSIDQSPRARQGIEDRFSDDEHDHYRESFVTDLTMDSKRLSTMTDDTSDLLYVDKVTAGQHVVPVNGANPEYVSQPIGVESAVASLVEPSVLSQHESPQHSHKSSFVQEHRSNQSLQRDTINGYRGSPLKEQFTTRSDSNLEQSRHVDLSPPQSPALSYEEDADDYIQHQTKSSPLPREYADVHASPQSEITTNPSVIQGPIGGLGAGHPEWMADAATPPIPSAGGMSGDFSSGAIDLIPEGLNVSQRHTYDSKGKTYTIGQSIPTPPGVKDEGYATGDNYPSPGPITKAAPALDTYDLDDDYDDKVDDPFTAKRNMYMSGLSQGMSPLYDNATGRGIDRIQSKDIVALMDHLTVRDAQRNARDTEILVTLVRSAADMRNSFEEMKAFISDQDELIMRTADKQHEYTQKVVGGPRPLPATTNNRSARTTPMQDDIPTKRRNVFKRALQGLGSKNSAELQNIESMLMQLLDEVEALRGQQGIQSSGPSQLRSNSLASEDNARPATETGYEPEGRAGTASTGGDRSGFFSTNSSRQGQHASARKFPENRVSTVMEGDEEYDDYDPNQYTQQQASNQHPPHAVSPVQEDDYYRQHRGQSVPLSTPPRIGDQPRALSTENTPQISDWGSGKKENNRDSRKTLSSVLPKFVSRWSKTTTESSNPRTPNFRGPTDAQVPRSSGKQRPYSQVSHSGSGIDQYAYDYDATHNPADDRLRSAASLQNDEYYQQREQENRPPSPLVPSAISGSEDPKYQSHRDSQDLMHPQPRQGPTGRYQFHLENAAKDYHQTSGPEAHSPISAHSQPVTYAQQDHGQSYATDARAQTHSPISDFGMQEAKHNRSGSAASSLTRRTGGIPKPPRSVLSDDANEPLVPQRSHLASPGQGFANSAYRASTMSPSTYIDDVRAARAGSPAFDKSPVAAIRGSTGNLAGRKPSGPRPLSSGSNKADATKRARFEDGSI